MPETKPTEDTRERVLRATLALVGEGGVANISNRNVARAAGVSLGAITYYFDNQASLLRESLELFIGEETERLAALTGALTDAELTEDQAIAALQALLELEPERRIAKFELYLHATRDTEIRDAAMECFESYEELARTALEALGVEESESMAPILVAIIDGLQLRRLASGEQALNLLGPLGELLKSMRNSQPK